MKKNKTPLVALVVLVLVGVVGGTIAYFTSTETFENLFGTGKYSTTIKETFENPENWLPGTTTPKTVEVTNNGNVPVVVRAKINDETKGWYDGDTKLSLEENVTINETVDSGWTKHTDGYYYYNKILASGAKTTKSFIESVTFNKDAELGEAGQACTYTYTYKDGTEIKVNDGNTFIQIVPVESEIIIE